MEITPRQAIVMFARYCRARFGNGGIRKARIRAMALEQRGDSHGQLVWNQVAEEIEKGTPRRGRGPAQG